MKIVIGSTRAGLALKKEVVFYLEQKGITPVDLGMKEGGEFVSYNTAAANVARAISCNEYEKGIVICGTGAGSAIVANKFKNVYAVHVTNTFEAKKSSAINAANVLVLAEWLTPAKHATEIIDAWLETKFGDGFDTDWQNTLKSFLQEIKKMETENFK